MVLIQKDLHTTQFTTQNALMANCNESKLLGYEGHKRLKPPHLMQVALSGAFGPAALEFAQAGAQLHV